MIPIEDGAAILMKNLEPLEAEAGAAARLLESILPTRLLRSEGPAAVRAMNLPVHALDEYARHMVFTAGGDFSNIEWLERVGMRPLDLSDIARSPVYVNNVRGLTHAYGDAVLTGDYGFALKEKPDLAFGSVHAAIETGNTRNAEQVLKEFLATGRPKVSVQFNRLGMVDSSSLGSVGVESVREQGLRALDSVVSNAHDGFSVRVLRPGSHQLLTLATDGARFENSTVRSVTVPLQEFGHNSSLAINHAGLQRLAESRFDFGDLAELTKKVAAERSEGKLITTF